jgi:hypothetical protein
VQADIVFLFPPFREIIISLSVGRDGAITVIFAIIIMAALLGLLAIKRRRGRTSVAGSSPPTHASGCA